MAETVSFYYRAAWLVRADRPIDRIIHHYTGIMRGL